jgi:large subunit ribosomal protein L23
MADKAHSEISVIRANDTVRRPRITEKAARLSEGNVYTFDVAPHATKPEVAKAIALIYNVTPLRITVVNIPKKGVRVRGRAGMRSGGRKAMVTLKKGDTISLA